VLISKKGLELLPNFYDYYYNEKQKEYQYWSTLSSNFEIGNGQEYHEVTVPTSESQRATYLAKMLLNNNYHVLISGPTGTGKTINVNQLLTTGMGENYQYIPITFSAQTSANQTQDSIDLKLEKIKRGVYGAPVGKKYIVFVDDLNMPKKEEYKAQPPIELLRQFLDHKGWYNRKDQQFMRIENILILTALGPPGGGRTQITPRIVRHFNMMNTNELDSKTISHIFSTILKHFLKRFPEDVKGLIPAVVDGVIKVYNEIKINLLPTPKKSHYTFNLRDISKVFQGICSASSKYVTAKDTFARLWMHEIERVFGDRLTCNEDRNYLRKLSFEQFPTFDVEVDEESSQAKVLFCDFWEGRDTEPRHYMQVPSQSKLMEKIYECQ
jgi:dynein heavy chain, axonemal